MATTLTEIWSRLLLLADVSAAREAEALRRHLLDRAHIRVAADSLERWPQFDREMFCRGAPEIAPRAAAPTSPRCWAPAWSR